MANAVTASARYVATCLKLAVNIQASCKDDIDPEKDVGELVVCLLAHLWYLQEEFTNVLVAGSLVILHKESFVNCNRILVHLHLAQ